MSYADAKKKYTATQYLLMREAQQKIGPADNRPARSIAWMAKYRALQRPSRFNWEPRFPYTPIKPGETNAESKIIEGEYSVVAHADASGQINREVEPARGIEAPRAGIETPKGGRPTRRAKELDEGEVPF